MRQPWWMTDTYDGEHHLPLDFYGLAGPEGLALTRAWPNGTTDPGWGMPDFIEKYNARRFARVQRALLEGYTQGKWAFAIIMRSVKIICIDIDGKNGGFEHAGKLGMLPLTKAETSKSGNGYHLFYSVSEDEWDPASGFSLFADRIGIQQGVDIRYTGCVYHHSTQRWNDRRLVELPEHIKQMLRERQQQQAAMHSNITKVLTSGDDEEVLLMHDALIEDLKKPIPQGKRNNTLFAIGSQMATAQVPDWETLVFDRAVEVGLDNNEAHKLVDNIGKYAPAVTP